MTRNHQQVSGGQPLDGGRVDVEFGHEFREQHVGQGFGQDADECHDARRDDGEHQGWLDAVVAVYQAIVPAARGRCGGRIRCRLHGMPQIVLGVLLIGDVMRSGL